MFQVDIITNSIFWALFWPNNLKMSTWKGKGNYLLTLYRLKDESTNHDYLIRINNENNSSPLFNPASCSPQFSLMTHYVVVHWRQTKWSHVQFVFKHGISSLEMCPDLRQSHLYPRLNFTQPAFNLSGPINLYTASGPAESSWLQRSSALPEGWGGSGADSLLVHWLASNLDWKDNH